MNIRKIKYPILFALVVILTGCGQKREKLFDLGTIEDGVYHNSYFGFSIDVPQGMTALDSEGIMAARESGSGLLEDSQRARRALQAAEVNTEILLQIEYGELIENVAPNINVVIENLAGSGIKNAEDYLKAGLKQMEMLNINYTGLDQSGRAVELGGRRFVKAELAVSAYGIDMQQDMYVTIFDQFALIISTNYTAQSKEIVDNILATIRFDR